MDGPDYTIRAYQEGDEASLLALYNKYYGQYAGSVPRSLQHWLWCCTSHPDISSDGIFVASKGREIVGYAVTGRLSHKEGSFLVYELCYDPNEDGEAVVLGLFEQINAYIAAKKGNYVNFDAPSDDMAVRRACEKLGFKQNPLNEVMSYIVLDMPKLLEQIIKAKCNEWKRLTESFLIRLKDVHPPQNIISIQHANGETLVSNQQTPSKFDAAIETDSSTLSKLIFGGESIFKAFLNSKLVIKPLWKARKSISFLSLLTLKDRWYIPRLDQI